MIFDLKTTFESSGPLGLVPSIKNRQSAIANPRSLWCSPAKHACLSCRRSPERSRSGTPISTPPKHFQRCPRSVSESARCNSGWGLQFLLAMRKHRSRTSVQAGVISQPGPGQHRGLRGICMPATMKALPPCSRLQISFVKKSCRGGTGWRLQYSARVAQ